VPEYNGLSASKMDDQAPDSLLAQSIQGDASAEALFNKYSSRVYYLALRQLRSPADAEDVRAETFLRVLRAIQNQQVRSPDALGSFVLGTARNVILEVLRAPHRMKHDHDIPDLPSFPQDTSPVDEDVARAIEIVIRRLKPRERDFLRLHYYEDLGKEEIARRIGIAEERVRLIKHRTLKSFREIYQQLTKSADTKGDTKRG
jgi:RNA polymerase sigma-70 factor (ECF subfamily)